MSCTSASLFTDNSVLESEGMRYLRVKSLPDVGEGGSCWDKVELLGEEASWEGARRERREERVKEGETGTATRREEPPSYSYSLLS
eukprot:CAMPEP_0196586186 /NCGR_PEP_ID=MMETSP1081-20130531/53465_1 /TAXON_ID=36882 /ORGANISM="Pyramimonas amylifera, Strain CCMP720" /LENGTH=85 /DNA_ID=CAMNT_0041907981 /DNA_START=107 /DNA_END=364 /DNA_ORIENTATION=-